MQDPFDPKGFPKFKPPPVQVDDVSPLQAPDQVTVPSFEDRFQYVLAGFEAFNTSMPRMPRLGPFGNVLLDDQGNPIYDFPGMQFRTPPASLGYCATPGVPWGSAPPATGGKHSFSLQLLGATTMATVIPMLIYWLGNNGQLGREHPLASTAANQAGLDYFQPPWPATPPWDGWAPLAAAVIGNFAQEHGLPPRFLVDEPRILDKVIEVFNHFGLTGYYRLPDPVGQYMMNLWGQGV